MKITSKIFTLCLFLFPMTLFASPAEQLTHLLGGFSSYQANFKQWVLDDHQQIQSSSQGSVEIKRPNRFRWLTSAPNNTLIIANADKLWHYDIDLQQATLQTIKPGAQVDNPAILLSGKIHQLGNDFNVSYITLQGQQWYALSPKSKQNYKNIYLYFNKSTLEKIIVLNNLDQRSLFVFSHIKLNQHISDALFEFHAPKGVDVNVQK